MWADSLTESEAAASYKAAQRLTGVQGAEQLLATTRAIRERLEMGFRDKAEYQRRPIQPNEMPFLFELRVAAALTSLGAQLRYEEGAGVGNSTIDLVVDLGRKWWVELVSLRETEGFKSSTWTAPVQGGEISGFGLTSDAKDHRQKPEWEMIKAQQRILAKAFDRNRKQPTKFPVPAGDAVHMILVDARGYLGAGQGDVMDWRQMCFGPSSVPDHAVHYWDDKPIRGLFEPTSPQEGAETMRNRIHFVGFLCEEDFGPDDLRKSAYYCANSSLFKSTDEVRELIKEWPLMPDVQQRV
jgi:hypothetical protein